MKIALVHDYIKEFGGAERVLMTLHEMFPEAPIYTAFKTPGSTAAEAFKDARIITSWADWLIRYKNLHSVLRFLVPLIWESFDFSKFDVVILSSSGYLTKPVRIPKNVRVICYCHTPPRFLYDYPGMDYRNYWYVQVYKTIIAHFLRLYDWYGAQRVNQFIANSQETAARIKKFYRRDSMVIYPPVST
ncbi:glycosyltransferase [Candidatus Gottesmanbacteria bacterium]|nr:glycosyltransferase [Candidatus Gottesmanbacteria bacterium]